MPRAGGAARTGGKGGLLIGVIVVVVLLAGLGVGGHFWSRSSAMSTAQKYMDAAMGLFKTGQPDAVTIKSVLVADQAAKVDQGEGPLFDVSRGAMARMLTMITATYAMGEGEIGLTEATVNATLTGQILGRQIPVAVKIALVREGLSWKVDEKESQFMWPGGGGAPQL